MLFLIPALAKADSLWQYQSQELNGYQFSGNNYNGANCNCYIDGTVDFSSIVYNPSNPGFLPSNTVVSWNFTDGTHTLTNLNSTAYFYPFTGLSTPNVPFSNYQYTVVINGNNGVDFYITAYDISESTDAITVGGGSFGSEEGHPGTWTQVVATPEPSALLLLVAGLAGLVLACRR